MKIETLKRIYRYLMGVVKLLEREIAQLEKTKTG